ncbi:unnamed protein product [Trichobilharzia regenti]|nr:unnamed protein product [Trichobilharzia regenti]
MGPGFEPRWEHHYSLRNAERNLVRITPNSIGPGQYNPYGDHWEKIIETARERSIVEAERPLAVPRFMDKVVQQLHKDNFPSPCAYNIQDKQFSKSDGSQTPFNTEEKRFKDKVIETPAPNRYDLQDGAISRRWLKRFQPKPFDATAERFTSKSDPGPGSLYDLTVGLISEYVRRDNISMDGMNNGREQIVILEKSLVDNYSRRFVGMEVHIIHK